MKQNVKIRWNSLYFMLRRVYQFRRFVDQWINENRNDVKIVKIRLIENEWKLILFFENMLKTFYEITLIVFQITNVNVQIEFIVFNVLYDYFDFIVELMRLNQFSNKTLFLIVCEKIIKKFKKYYVKTINENKKIYSFINILNLINKLSFYENWNKNENFEKLFQKRNMRISMQFVNNFWIIFDIITIKQFMMNFNALFFNRLTKK